jgi:hypothetical protein
VLILILSVQSVYIIPEENNKEAFESKDKANGIGIFVERWVFHF